MLEKDSSELFGGALPKFTCLNSGFSVVIDDDGKVAYGYILNETDQICGDVWLYNRQSTPVQPEWINPELMPFLNDFHHAGDCKDFVLPASTSEFAVDWTWHTEKRAAIIFIRDIFHAMLVDGLKPGWCVLAQRDGPLAKSISRNDHSGRGVT